MRIVSQSGQRSASGRIAAVLLAVVGFFALLVVELIAAMFTYGYLQLAHTDFFGSLVRVAADVLQVVSSQIDWLFPSQANQIYASTFGELGPKSILLLLIGLVVGALFRVLVWGVVSMFKGLRVV